MRQLSIVTSQIATLANLSGGRLRLGVGVGGEWPREWEAAGVPTSERGARLNESLPLLRKLLAGTQVDFSGRFNVLSGVSVSPVPPRVPIYLAGRADAALERVGREGDGWIGFFLTPNGFRRDSAAIDAARRRVGRETLPFDRGMLLNFQLDDDAERAEARALELNLGFAQELRLAANNEQLKRFALAGTPATVLARLREYVAAGCMTFCVAPMEKDNAGFQRQIRRFAAEILPRL
jgi:alkanesulfonate monooxygenase SsuD/methylene tetrahydromethanopterin reductase-like flavin-dependent oxidoreductase (luciferase family)